MEIDVRRVKGAGQDQVQDKQFGQTRTRGIELMINAVERYPMFGTKRAWRHLQRGLLPGWGPYSPGDSPAPTYDGMRDVLAHPDVLRILKVAGGRAREVHERLLRRFPVWGVSQ